MNTIAWIAGSCSMVSNKLSIINFSDSFHIHVVVHFLLSSAWIVAMVIICEVQVLPLGCATQLGGYK